MKYELRVAKSDRLTVVSEVYRDRRWALKTIVDMARFYLETGDLTHFNFDVDSGDWGELAELVTKSGEVWTVVEVE
jgi:hypothetical protein